MFKSPLRPFLDLSTAHLTVETREWLNGQRYDYATHWIAQTPYGWFLWVPTDYDTTVPIDPIGYPADLLACFAKARELGADYILFDQDAEPNEGLLPDYDNEDPYARQFDE